MGYLFVELVNNNNATRRIYSVFDNPKKLAYLSRKGLLNREEQASFPQSNQNDEKSRQNDETPNGGESRQNDDNRLRIKEEESKRAPLTAKPEPSRRPLRSEYQTEKEWEEAFYKYMTLSA